MRFQRGVSKPPESAPAVSSWNILKNRSSCSSEKRSLIGTLGGQDMVLGARMRGTRGWVLGRGLEEGLEIFLTM